MWILPLLPVPLWHAQGQLYLYFASYLMMVSNSDCIASTDWTVIDYELASIWNETAVAPFKILCWHLSEALTKIIGKP
jgi:hypothetical protein